MTPAKITPLRQDKDPKPAKRYEFTDVGNAERLADALQGQVVFCAPLGGWLFNNGEKYEPTEKARMKRAAIKLVKEHMLPKVSSLERTEHQNLLAWYRASQSSSRINAMVSLAEGFLRVDVDRFDEDPLLINLKNGVFDLSKGEFRSRTKDNYFTHRAEVSYEKGAKCPAWKEFLRVVLRGDRDYERYLQKLCGYCLSGETGDQAIYNLYGLGANGKSTFLRLIHDILGDYAASVPTDVLLKRKYSGGPNPFVAALKDVRFVMATEFNEGDALDAARVKSLTGGEPVSADAKHKDPITYIPRFKIFVGTNHALEIRETDEGTWRRIRMLPFTHQFKESEKKDDFHKVLLRERNGILIWMLEGWKMYQEEGLKPPSVIQKATDSYRTEQDNVGQFLDECTQERSNEKVLLKEVYERYESWCRQEKVASKSKRQFSKELRERGIKVEKSTKNQVYVFGRQFISP